MNKVMVIGLGDVGGHQLEILARTRDIDIIYAADINEKAALRRVYSARSGAAHLGIYSNIEFVKIDLDDVDGTASALKKFGPDIVMHNATMMSNVEWACLPNGVPEKLASAGIGNITPCHLTLTYKLMRAVRKAMVDTHVVMSPYPDVVNCVLGKVGLARNLIGLGNLDYITPGLQKAAAHKLGAKITDISVYLVAPYAVLNRLFRFGTAGGLPYHLRIHVKEKDVTDRLNPKDLFAEVGKYLSLFTIYDLGYIAASSGVKNALAILNDTRQLTHAPGPLGLPGGYPIRLGARGAEVALPEGISLQEAVQTNERALTADGIEKIKDDGTIVFTEQCYTTWKEIFNYDCKELKIEDCEKKAKELLSLHSQLAHAKLVQ